jgi:hypothetical protein
VVTGHGQVDPDVGTGEAGRIDILAELGKAGSGGPARWPRPELLARGGTPATDQPAFGGPVPGRRLHIALGDGGLVASIRVDRQRDDHRQQEAGDDGDAPTRWNAGSAA